MTASGRTVLAGVAAGAVSAVVLTMTVFAGATEAATTGAVLVGFAVGWAVMAVLGRRRSGRAQRWAVVPGVAMGLTGLALILARPDGRAMDALTWVWPPLMLALVAWVWRQLRRSVPGRTRWTVAPVLVVRALASVGAVAGNVAVAHDRTSYPAERMYDVGGHRLHLDCRGTGSPTVVLSNGLGERSDDWARVVAPLSESTRVCAYDRAGQGWSDEADSPRDGIESAEELHTLLDRAGEHPPYVLVGHSTGGAYAMTYAARNLDDVAGMVLVDSSSPEQFTRMPAYPRQYQVLRRIYGPLATLSRTGIGIATSSPKSFRSQRDEVSVIPQVFRQAQALTTLGDRPLVVLTASHTAERTDGWSAAQEALAGLSTSSVRRTVSSTHQGMISDPRPAAEVVRAVRDVLSRSELTGR
jgi:pimeloyl-ACP methyl ester carboxylesterase